MIFRLRCWFGNCTWASTNSSRAKSGSNFKDHDHAVLKVTLWQCFDKIGFHLLARNDNFTRRLGSVALYVERESCVRWNEITISHVGYSLGHWFTSMKLVNAFVGCNLPFFWLHISVHQETATLGDFQKLADSPRMMISTTYIYPFFINYLFNLCPRAS